MKFREGTIIGVILPSEEMGPSWRALIDERGKEFSRLIYLEYGFAEEVICMIYFLDGSFEVGVGESLRPYELLYAGNDLEEASRAFLEAVQIHTWWKNGV